MLGRLPEERTRSTGDVFMKKIQKSFQLLTALLCLSAIPLRGNNAKGDIETIGNRRVARRSIISQGMEARMGTAYVISTDIAQPSIPLALAKFSRRQELEADFLGVQYLYKSGYDPNAFVTLLEKSSNIEASASAGSRKHRFHASHPQIEERI